MSTDSTAASKLDWRLELVQIPVADVDRAKAFYIQAGFVAEHDHQVSDELRFVQLTPPGSACSIALTSGAHQMEPGSLEGLQLVVADVEVAREELLARGIEVGEVQEFPWGRFISSPTPTATPGRSSRSARWAATRRRAARG
ncbi:MAG TPA: glyoxalase [Solirubrobacterales bacterium]|jgi:predicted enzyme related to lactoylglutathione lyase